MRKPHHIDTRLLGDTEHIIRQATTIRDVAQAIIDACQSGERVDPYAWSKMQGNLAGDVATLGIMMIMNVLENEHA